MQTVTLQAKDFTTVHNAVCELRSVQERLTGVIHNDLADRLQSILKSLEAGLADAYRQDDEKFETKMARFSAVQEELGLTAVWSIYDIENMSDRHPFEGADRVVYKDHWGKPVSCSINGLTWAALYVAGNACIRDSGDNHHIFIEQFVPAKDDPRTLIMRTGS
jgi:hypothetical protein